MKRHVFSAALAGVGVLLGGMVAGCNAPEPEPTPTPVVTPTPTSSPSPTSRWSERGQLAIDGVQTYLDKWTEISQTLDTASTEKLAEIYDVAGRELGSDVSSNWVDWMKRGLHIVGSPTFEVDSVRNLGVSGQFWRYAVTGCHSIEGSYLADAQGNPADITLGEERTVATYIVSITADFETLVIKDEDSGESC